MPAADVTRPSEAFHALMQRLQKMHCAVARREMRVAERGRHLPLNYALARFSDHPAKRINELWPDKPKQPQPEVRHRASDHHAQGFRRIRNFTLRIFTEYLWRGGFAIVGTGATCFYRYRP
jgi:hypothetical protein